MQRAFMLAFAASFLMLWLATQHAQAAVSVSHVDVDRYPTFSLSVVTSSPSKAQPRLWEAGLPAGGVKAVNLGSSKAVAIALDRSRSMAGEPLRDAAGAANSFVNAKPAADSIGVVAFGSHALALTGFSTSTIDADGALRSISLDAHQGTALYDAVVLASGQLAAQPARGRVLVLLTDGDDTSSRATLDRAIRAARRAGVAVYSIGIDGEGFTPEPLRQLAAATGGRFFLAADSDKLEQVYSTIASELARTWQLSYLTTARPGENIKLRVTVPGQGAAARDVQVPGEPGGAAAPPGPSRLFPESFYRSKSGTLAVAIAVGFCLLLAAAVVLAAKKSVWLRRRLEPHVAAAQSRGARRAKKEQFAFAATLIRATERALGNVRHFRALSKRLERADMPLRAAEFAYIMLGCGIALGLVAGLATGSLIGLVFGFALGAAAPFGFVAFKARKRLKAFDNQLPDLLVTLAASLKAGHSFRQGIQTVVDEGQEPASREFKRVLTDTQLGRPMEDSLTEMAERVNSKNFSFVINAVTIQRQVGGSLAGLLDMVAETVRQRQQFARRIRSLTAMGRLSAYVLVCLPFFLASVMTLINRSFMEPLWTRHAGHVLLGLGMTMMLIGSAILKKIVSFKG